MVLKDIASFRYWREVLGCQKVFDCFDRYMQTDKIKWGYPCIWTCNNDNDPRKIPEVRDYVEENSNVLEVVQRLY
jgi:hypothetical protein